jgi:hypothetical protein
VSGQVVDVSRTGMGLIFPAAQLRHAAGVRQESIIQLQIGLDGLDEPLVVMGRVAWLEFPPASGDAVPEGRVGLEFVAMPSEARSRLIHLLDASERPATPPA